jgi:hypothetical protein
MASMSDAVENIRRRDEMLQILYWMQGEGLGEKVHPSDLLPFLGIEEAAIQDQLEQLALEGYVDLTGDIPARYYLTEWGSKEAGRRFADEFAGLTGQAHGECNNPNCSCHVLGPGACDIHTTHSH